MRGVVDRKGALLFICSIQVPGLVLNRYRQGLSMEVCIVVKIWWVSDGSKNKHEYEYCKEVSQLNFIRI